MRVLITDSDNRSALAATRSLGRLDHTVFTAGIAHPSLASVSKYSAGFDPYRSPYESAEGFVEDVGAILERRQIDVVLPMTEISTLLLTGHRPSLPPNVRMPFPDYEVVAAAADKSQVLKLAQKIGVPIPKTQIIESPDQARAIAGLVEYPTVFKPARSRTWTGTGWVSGGVGYAKSPDELLQRLSELNPAIFPILVQERIQGPGVGVFVCCDKAMVLATFAHKRVREKPPSGGVSVLCESVAVDPTAKMHATALLKELGWRGVAMVEFKQDLRDGSLKLMEINGRFWGSLQLAIDAGVNFPELALDVALERRHAAPGMYRVGVRSRWFWGDVDAMLALILRSRQQLNLPSSHPGKWPTLARFLNFWDRNTRHELERRDDFRPAWLEAKRWLLNKR